MAWFVFGDSARGVVVVGVHALCSTGEVVAVFAPVFGGLKTTWNNHHVAR